MQKCHKYCEKIEEELEKHLENTSCKEQYLNISKHLIRIKFQHCAILSQLNLHEKALEMCRSTLPAIENYIKSILEYVESLLVNCCDKKSSEIVHFSRQVCSLAQEILMNLLKCLNEPMEVNKGKSSFYYWQKNP
jgi:vacuolar-type H+-ATPase subunit E/Vma4